MTSLGPWKNRDNALSNYFRFNDLKGKYDSDADILRFQEAFPNVNFRYYVEPTEDIPGGLDIINVDNSTITWPLQEMGRRDGDAAVKKGEGKSFEEMKERFLQHEWT